ncbi:cellulose binding domain-containing protein [Catenuloplanes indicus]|uniref:CBM2 domain-containing protein n=1 Tax=Catenuloplanes indicus TaxID=137267 RepID=A0AAE3W6X4_9ACTN|nr:cellulose binding domain-containing protein [Catenuloplanes indicus]MDQ0370659.1 hypothetical protein [Catenuloplanes indicus]
MRGGIATLVAACLAAILPAVPASAAAAGEPCNISYRPTQGGEVFDVYLVITNTSDYQINGWTLAFVLPEGQSYAGGAYGVEVTVNGREVIGRHKEWNKVVDEDGEVSLGFKIKGSNWRVEPTEFTVNGGTCTVS